MAQKDKKSAPDGASKDEPVIEAPVDVKDEAPPVAAAPEEAIPEAPKEPAKPEKPELVVTFDRWFAMQGRPDHWKAGMRAYANTAGKKPLSAWDKIFSSY